MTETENQRVKKWNLGTQTDSFKYMSNDKSSLICAYELIFFFAYVFHRSVYFVDILPELLGKHPIVAPLWVDLLKNVDARSLFFSDHYFNLTNSFERKKSMRPSLVFIDSRTFLLFANIRTLYVLIESVSFYSSAFFWQCVYEYTVYMLFFANVYSCQWFNTMNCQNPMWWNSLW